MQLKLKRSQDEEKGFLSKKTWYVLDVLADFSPEEQAVITRDKLGDTLLYDTMEGDGMFDQPGTGGRRKHAFINVKTIAKGHQLRASDLGMIVTAEEHLKRECKHLNSKLKVSGSFQGEEEVVDFDDE